MSERGRANVTLSVLRAQQHISRVRLGGGGGGGEEVESPHLALFQSKERTVGLSEPQGCCYRGERCQAEDVFR